MNYLKSIIFFIVILFVNYIFGIACAKMLRKEANFSKKIVFGFLILFLLGFIVGLPAQILSISWNAYFVIFSLVLLLSLFFAIKYIREDLKITFKRIKERPIHYLGIHLKKYWLVYALVVLFSLLSVTNTQPYLWCNYHDDYYIAKVVNLQGALHLLDEQYVLGIKLNRTGLLSYAMQQGYRALNTYELTYAYLGSVFTIDLTFFCRFSMTIYCYLMCFFVYKVFVEMIIDNQNVSQYALAFFTLLLIPAGLASAGKFPIRMFENWRFQTAIFYGGSIVRVMGFPLMLISFKNILKEINKKSVISFALVFVVLFSFQVTALCYLLLVLPIFIFIKAINVIINKCSGIKKVELCVIISICFITFFLMSDKIIPYNSAKYQSLMNSYLPYYNDIFICDIFALTGIIPIIMIMYLKRSAVYKEYFSIILLALYLIIRLNKSAVYLMYITNDQFFGILRLLTSILLMIVAFWGIFAVVILEKINIKNLLIPILSATMMVTSLTYIYTNKEDIKKYTKEAQSATPLGYSFSTLTNNDKMLPDMIVKVGDYFNKKPYGNYRLLSEGHIPYKNTYIDNESFLLASNRIELWFASTDDHTNVDYAEMLNYLKGKVKYKDVERIFKYAKFKYVFTTRTACKNDLLKHNFKVVLSDKGSHLWLLELQN